MIKGDKIKIINYGSLVWFMDDTKNITTKDLNPELVGQIGVIDEVIITQGVNKYSINGPNKHAWYYENQLEKIL